MTTGVSTTVLNAWLDGLGNAANWTAPAAFWCKLHLGDPGANGTANPAANTTRKQASFAAATGATITTDADIDWTNVPNAETYAYASFWDASVAGTFFASGILTVPRTVAVGDNFTIATGDIDIAIGPAAA